MVLTPDHIQKEIYENHIAHGMREGKTLMFAHGFNIHFGPIEAPRNVDVSMIAPKEPGHLVRRVFQEGGGVPALLAVHQDASETARQTALAYARGIGGTKGGVLETIFLEETETDLFGDQAVLCGGVSAAHAGRLRDARRRRLPARVGLLRDGPRGEADRRPDLRGRLRQHALLRVGHGRVRRLHARLARSVGPDIKARMKEILEEVQSGQFAREWILENQAGRPGFEAMRRRAAQHPSEEVGDELRGIMSWLREKAD